MKNKIIELAKKCSADIVGFAPASRFDKDDAIFKIMIEAKGNEQEQLKFKVNDLKSYFPKHYTIKQLENVIQKLLENYQKQWQKNYRIGIPDKSITFNLTQSLRL